MPIVIFMGSESDRVHADEIASTLEEFGIEAEIVVASAHKSPEKVIRKVEELNQIDNAIVIITCAGMSNGLSGVVAGSSIHPVIACPVFKDAEDYRINIHSTLQMPSEVPVMTVLNPKNAALAAAKILGESDNMLHEKLMGRIKSIKEKY